MDIYIERSKKSLSLEFSGKISEVLDRLGILPEEVLVVKNGVLVTEDEFVEQTDSLRLLSVISGG
jgi:sulfur carrier protein ThiS